MTDDRVPTTLLAVGITCIIILSMIIVWLIICCEKRRRATFRFKPGQGSTVYRNPSYLVKDPVIETSHHTHQFTENSIHSGSDNEEMNLSLLEIPIHEQITAILGSFPDITDYKPLDFSDTDSIDECDSASLIAKTKDSKSPSIIKLCNPSSKSNSSSITNVNVEINVHTDTDTNTNTKDTESNISTQSQKESDSDTNIHNSNSTILNQSKMSHTFQFPQDENIYDKNEPSLSTSTSTMTDGEANGNQISMFMLETTI